MRYRRVSNSEVMPQKKKKKKKKNAPGWMKYDHRLVNPITCPVDCLDYLHIAMIRDKVLSELVIHCYDTRQGAK